MGLSVNTNIAAMNAYRNLSGTQDAMSKSLERLSSGYRINRAADDAAGLAISEGLRSQIGGLTQAVRNTQDGTSVVQTAEGALNESTSILQRMRDLSVQAANSGSLNTTATGSIQKEMTQLKQELDRIAGTTTFNGSKLLDGTFNKLFQVGANAGETIGVSIGTAMSSTGLGVGSIDVTGTGSYSFTTSGTLSAGQVGVSTSAASGTAAVLSFKPKTGDYLDSASGTLASFQNLTGTISFGGKTFDLGSVDYGKAADTNNDGTTSAGEAFTALQNAAKSALGLANGPFTQSGTAGGNLTFSVTEAVSGYTDSNGSAIDDGTGSTQAQLAAATPQFAASTGASAAITAIDKAITAVSTVRADLGAKQNRFEHTINNLNTTIENTTASESRIRDTDMAQEMTKFTRAQVLTQAGTSMLAQANQSTQSILKLLG